MGVLVDLQGVSVFRDGNPILSDVSLTIAKGDHLAILGPNGAGKSTLVQLITREVYPHGGQGRIAWFGHERWVQADLRQLIQTVSPWIGVDPPGDPTVMDLALSGRVGSIGVTWGYEFGDADRQAVLTALRHVGIEALADRRIRTLSTGERRRALIARAMANQPRLLVLDEPTAGLDPGARRRFLAQLPDLAQTGTTLLLVTHHPEEISDLFKRVALLKGGKIQSLIAASELDAAAIQRLFD